MGNIERAHKNRRKKNAVRNIILGTIKTVGLVGLAVAVPNVLQHMEKLGLKMSPRQSDLIKRATQRMVKQGLLVWVNSKLQLTEKGRRTYLLQQNESSNNQRKHKWDTKWRVVIFDIPERRRVTRSKVRLAIQQFGFVRLQNSVWIYPYDCEELIVMLKADAKIGKALLYMIVDVLENDASLRSHFKLPPE